MTFDNEIRALLGPRPPIQKGVFSQANRDWDLAYSKLFPSAALPAYHPRRRKAETAQGDFAVSTEGSTEDRNAA